MRKRNRKNNMKIMTKRAMQMRKSSQWKEMKKRMRKNRKKRTTWITNMTMTRRYHAAKIT